MDDAKVWVRDTIERIVRTVVALVVGAGLTAGTAAAVDAFSDGSASVEDIRAIVFAIWTAASTAFLAWLAKFRADTISPASLVSKKT